MSATVQSASDRLLPRVRWLVLGLTLLNLFFLLGHRGLNEPDEGRYAEVAREMIERGDWLVPHFWYVPHLSKPPFTYWAVAGSLKVFGFNEWAVRLPVALAGLSGILAAFCLGRRLAGERAGLWAAVILQTTGLYAVMSRQLTTDIFLAQFVAWAGYFLWRSLDELREGTARWRFLGWHLAGWAAMGLGFLCKGPVAVVIPLAGVVALVAYRIRSVSLWAWLLLGLALGVAGCGAIAAPWFLLVERELPGALRYMLSTQVVGHAVGAVDNRTKSSLFFVAILAVGFLPWTALLGWLWRRRHWRTLTESQRGGWLFLSVWAGFAFLMFSLGRAKLPAYILPIFPPLAALVAARFLAEPAAWPIGLWNLRRVPLVSACGLWAGLPVGLALAFDNPALLWLWVLGILGMAAFIAAAVVSRYWSVFRCVAAAVAVMLAGCWTLYWKLPTLEESTKGYISLRTLGGALKAVHLPEDKLVIWAALPQGLPFYAAPLINPTNPPYLGWLNLTEHPFEFSGNRERLARQILGDVPNIPALLRDSPRVLVVGRSGTLEALLAGLPRHQVVLLRRSGRWDLIEVSRLAEVN